GIAWKLVKRTVNIAEYGNSKDEVNPAENRACNASVHDICCVDGLGHDVTPFEPQGAASLPVQLQTGWRTRRVVADSRRTSWRRDRRGVRWDDQREDDRVHRSRCASRPHPLR